MSADKRTVSLWCGPWSTVALPVWKLGPTPVLALDHTPLTTLLEEGAGGDGGGGCDECVEGSVLKPLMEICFLDQAG